jgi:hypothetical protein
MNRNGKLSQSGWVERDSDVEEQEDQEQRRGDKKKRV